MGVLIALHEDWAKRHRWWVIVAFVAVSGLGFYANVKHREQLEIEASKSPEEAAVANIFLLLVRGRSHGYYISRLQRENHALPDGRASAPIPPGSNTKKRLLNPRAAN
jgi:hypothetical protein